MIKSKLAALCLISVSVTLYAGSPADAWVLFPGHRDAQVGGEILSWNESIRGPVTAILTYTGGYVVIGDSYLYPATYDIWLMVIDENGDVQLGDCGEVGDTFVAPIPTSATVQSPSIPVIDKNIRVVDLSVDVVEQALPIEDCTPGGGLK